MEEKIVVEEESIPKQSLPRIRYSRPAWQEFILFIVSFSFYTSFWMVGRVREIKAMGHPNFKPALWFFVPLFSLFQLIAFPKFFKALKEIEGNSTSRNWKSYTGLWIATLVIINVIITFEAYLNLPEWILFVWLLTISLLFTILHQRFNSWKKTLENVDFHGIKSGYHWYEWIIVIVGGVLVSLCFYIYLIAPLFIEKIQNLDHQQVIENSELGFKLTIKGNGWTEVAKGTYSEDETKLELSGPLIDSYFVLFDQGVSNSLNSIARSRAVFRGDFTGTPNCNEDRYLSQNMTSVISYTECNGTFLGEKVTSYSTIIKSNNRFFELYGKISAAKHLHSKHSKYMRSIARGFKPI